LTPSGHGCWRAWQEKAGVEVSAKRAEGDKSW